MGWTSVDDMVNQISVNGKYLRRDGSKINNPASTAGGWHNTMHNGGYPNATTAVGTTLLWTNCDEFSGNGTIINGIQHGGPVLPATKHVLNVGANIVAAAGAPFQLKLVDLQGYYYLNAADSISTSSRTLINSNTFTASSSSGLLLTYTNNFVSGTKVRFTTSGTLPTGLSLATDYWLVRVSSTTARVATSYANYIAGTVIAYTDAGSGTHTMTIQMPRYANGVGCEAFFSVQTAPSGGGGPALTASSYTNSALTTARAFQGSPTSGASADAYQSRIIHSGNAAGRYGPFLPKQGADTGIASIQSFTLGATAYTGSPILNLCICRPLLDIAVPVTGMWSERDLVNQLPSLPQVQDGACLVWLLFTAGAETNNSPHNFTLDFGWGG
jgi:hypothetical protein